MKLILRKRFGLCTDLSHAEHLFDPFRLIMPIFHFIAVTTDWMTLE